MATTLQAPPQAHPARQKALEPFLERLRGWNATDGATHNLARKARITIGERTVTLEPWERQQLDLWFHGDGPRAHHLPVLAHGAALMLKAAFDIERLIHKADEASTTLYTLQAELMLDTAIGIALLKDAQHAIEDLVKAGGSEAAKGLTQFRHRLSRVVADARMCIAESEQAQAAVIARVLTDRPDRPERPAPLPRSASAPAPAARATPLAGIREPADDPVPAPVRRRSRPSAQPAAASRRGPSGTQVLALMCLASFAVWMAFVGAPRYMAQEAAVMTRAEFREGLPIGNVESRAPSVYVSMSQAAWDSMDDRGQLAFMQELGRTAAREAYTGLLLRNEAGVPLGQWLGQRGASVILDREQVAAPAIPPPPTAPAEPEAAPVESGAPAEFEALPPVALPEDPAAAPQPPAGG